MPLTDAQRRIYASAPSNAITKDTLTLKHSGFSQDWHITSYKKAFDGDLTAGGTRVTFDYVPFAIKHPTLDADGHQDMPLTIANVDPQFMAELNATMALPPEPIIVEYRSYTEHSPALPTDFDPSPDPALVLEVSVVSTDLTSISATATRADIVNAEFPHRYYTTRAFPGLMR